jgi:VanZ family protein
VCVGGSIAVELAQTLLPDRVPSLRDVVLNSVGAGLGVLIHAVAGHRRERSAHD